MFLVAKFLKFSNCELSFTLSKFEDFSAGFSMFSGGVSPSVHIRRNLRQILHDISESNRPDPANDQFLHDRFYGMQFTKEFATTADRMDRIGSDAGRTVRYRHMTNCMNHNIKIPNRMTP